MERIARARARSSVSETAASPSDSRPAPRSATFYRVDFAVDDRDPLQQELNRLYDYENDLHTKVLHRNRLNLFYLMMKGLIDRRVIRRFGTALDVGCNAGAYSRIISDYGFRSVVGIDIVPEMIAAAAAKFGASDPERRLEFRLENAEEMDTSRLYDFVLCTEVIEHTQQPGRVIENIQSVLAPQGVAVISMPNSISLPMLLDYLSSRIRGRPLDPVFVDHLRYPFYRSLRLFEDRRFRRVATDGTNLVLDTVLLRTFYGTAVFPALNAVNFRLSRLWPLKYVTQFFFMALVRRED